jgi:hypothetical protein
MVQTRRKSILRIFRRVESCFCCALGSGVSASAANEDELPFCVESAPPNPAGVRYRRFVMVRMESPLLDLWTERRAR